MKTVAVIGAGVIGLASAAALARRGHKVMVLEKGPHSGTGMSGHGSGVIHAGLYYPTGSLKTRHCCAGRELLYAWCENYRVPYRRVGKLILATAAKQHGELERLHDNALRAHIDGVELLETKQVKKLQPDVTCKGGLWVPASGIVNVRAFLDSLQSALERSGGSVSVYSKVVGVERDSGGYQLRVQQPASESQTLKFQAVVNAAGLYADEIATLAGCDVAAREYQLHFCKGHYFKLPQAAGKINHLLYPLPEAGLSGLGIHLTMDMNGAVRAGPDVEWLDKKNEDYLVDAGRAEAFRAAVQRYWPAAGGCQFIPDAAGIRAKRSRDGFRDFVIQEESKSGLPGWVNLLGMESPGLTSALSIADDVARLDLFA